MTHLSMNSRMVDWLHRQPDLIQAIVLGALPKHLEKELAMVIFSVLVPIEPVDPRIAILREVVVELA